MKKAISILLAAILLLCIAPVSLFASAEGEIHKSGIWTYELDSKSGTTYARILGVDRIVNGKIEIPETLAGYTVCEWEPDVFTGYSNYELVIPAGVPNKNYIDWVISVSYGNFPKATVSAVVNYDLYTNLFNYVSSVAAKKITVASGNAYYSSKDGVLYDKNTTVLIKYPVCSDALLYELPASVSLIPSFVTDYAAHANILAGMSTSEYVQSYPMTLLFDGCCVFFTNEKWASGLTVHVSAAHFNEALSKAAQYANGFTEKMGILAVYLEFPFFGTSTICTDYSDQTAIELLRELFLEFQNDGFMSSFSAFIPEVERCNGHAKTVKSISIASLPSKTTYTVGESFVQTGLSLNVTYSDGTSAVVSSGFSCTGFSSATTGTRTITVTYGSKTTTFTVQVNPAPAATLTSIALQTMPHKTMYTVGESFDQSGLSLMAVYSDGSTKTITSGFTCTGFSSNDAGTKKITVTYAGKSTTFTVTVQSNASMTLRTPSTNTIQYGYTLILHTQTANLPMGARIQWTVSGSGVTIQPSADTFDCEVKSVGSGSATVTAKLVDSNGSAIKDASGNAIQSQQYITSRAGFFQKLAYFFLLLFGANMTVQEVKQH